MVDPTPTEPLDLDALEAAYVNTSNISQNDVFALIAAARRLDAVTVERDAAIADARSIAETNLHAAAHIAGITDAAAMLRAEVATLTARTAALTALLGEAVEKLEPFAKQAGQIHEADNDARIMTEWFGTNPPKVGDFRRARALIAKINEAINPVCATG